MNKNEFIKGNQYTYKGAVNARIYTYSGDSYSQGVGIFKDFEGTPYHLKYTKMIPHTQPEPQYPNPPLPHCEERIAFAKGANIEFEDRCGTHSKWMFTGYPKWHPNIKYRVKVEKTEDDLRIEVLESCICDHQAILDDYKKELAELKPTVHY
jgi:hypothetical protein